MELCFGNEKVVWKTNQYFFLTYKCALVNVLLEDGGVKGSMDFFFLEQHSF